MAKKTDLFYPDRIVGGRFVTQAVKALVYDLEEQEVEVCIRPRRRYTSQPQMRYYRGVCVAMLGEHMRDLGVTGPHGGPITNEQVHQMMAQRWLRKHVLVNPDTGEGLDIIESTAQLTTARMTEYIEAIRAWALETFDLRIPDPNEAGDMRLA